MMNRDPARTKSRNNPFDGGIIEAHITSVDDDRGEMRVEFANNTGTKTIPIAALNSGMNSRRRDHPEVGGIVILTYCKNNSAIPQVLGYRSRSDQNDFINGGQAATSVQSQYLLPGEQTSEKIPVRRLTSGEQEDSTAGGAYAFRSLRGDHEIGAGLVRTIWSRVGLDVVSQTPEFVIEMADFDSGSQSDVFRVGNATRHSGANKNYNEADSAVAKEYYLDLTGRGTQARLVRIRKGNVLDEGGAEVISTITGEKLRSFEEYYTKTGNVAVYEVDELGNMSWELPSDATKGFTFNMKGDNSTFNLNVGKDLNQKVTKAGKHEYGTTYEHKVGSHSTETVGGNKESTISGSMRTAVSGSGQIKAGGVLVLKGSKVLIN